MMRGKFESSSFFPVGETEGEGEAVWALGEAEGVGEAVCWLGEGEADGVGEAGEGEGDAVCVLGEAEGEGEGETGEGEGGGTPGADDTTRMKVLAELMGPETVQVAPPSREKARAPAPTRLYDPAATKTPSSAE